MRGGEATIAELGASVARLRESERSTSDEAARLRAKNDWMAARIDALLELVGRLEEADRAHRAAAGELRLRAERHCAREVPYPGVTRSQGRRQVELEALSLIHI